VPSGVEQIDDHSGAVHETGVPPPNFPVVATPEVLVTFDTKRTEHIISDEQLMHISRGGSDISLELCLAAAGICAGFSQNLYAACLDISAGTVVGGWNAFGAFVCVVCGTMAIVYGIAYSAVRSDMKALIAKIKGRKLGRMPTSTGAASISWSALPST
jgi:hypothetical protein